MLPNFKLNNSSLLSALMHEKGIVDYISATEYIQSLPYGRIIDTTDLTNIIHENKGTCSTKHAFLHQLAAENEISDINLALGFFKMNAINTPAVAEVLKSYGLEYIPEAHNYLLYKDKRYDFTGLDFQTEKPTDVILSEMTILPNQIKEFKQHFHRFYIINWLKEENLGLKFSIDEIWDIRETCIQQLSSLAV